MKITTIEKLYPPSTIGIIVGGQLGKMIAFQAKRLGYKVIVLDPKESSPAGQVVDTHIVADYADILSLEQLAEKSDVITYEFEHIDVEALKMRGCWQ